MRNDEGDQESVLIEVSDHALSTLEYSHIPKDKFSGKLRRVLLMAATAPGTEFAQ